MDWMEVESLVVEDPEVAAVVVPLQELNLGLGQGEGGGGQGQDKEEILREVADTDDDGGSVQDVQKVANDGQDEVMKGHPEDVPDKSNFSYEVLLGHEMLFDRIAPHLSGADLTALRAVSRLTLSMVNNRTKFLDCMKLKVRLRNSCVLRTAAQSNWKNLVFDVDGWKGHGTHNKIRRMLLTATHLELVPGENNGYYVSKDLRIYIHHEFFSKSPELKSLVVDLEILSRELNPVFKHMKVKQQLAQLDKFYITAPKYDEVKIGRLRSGSEPHENVIHNLFFIDRALRSLTEFGLEGIYFNPSLKLGPYRRTFYQVIWKLLKRHKRSLQELALKGDITNFRIMSYTKFPSLQVLSVEPAMDLKSPFAFLGRFIRTQDLLEGLSLKFSYGCKVGFIAVIGGISRNLKTLSISAPILYNQLDNEGNLTTLSMNFLQNMKHLEEFTFDQHEEDSIPEPNWVVEEAGALGPKILTMKLVGRELMTVLPPTLTKLVLTYVDMCGTRALPNLAPTLTHLSLLGCHNGVYDDVLQLLFSKGHLTVLEFSHSDIVTDACLNGTNGYLFRLADFKGLRKLTIFECPNISEAGLLDSVKFQELQHLSLWLNKEMSEEALVKIASSNPSLEHVSSPFRSTTGLAAQIREVCPRLKSCESENFEIMVSGLTSAF